MPFDRTNPLYLQWINTIDLDPELTGLFEAASDDELAAAFNIKLEFGTAGLRGVLGGGPGRFNVYTVKEVTYAFAQLLKSKYPNELARGVVIGHDNRHNSDRFAQLAAEVLTSYGITAYLFANNDMKPTPVVSFATRALNCLGGIVITASHNPAEYNGYKIYDENGCQLLPEDTDVLTQRMLDAAISDVLNWKFTTQKELLKTVPDSILDKYRAMIKNLEFYPQAAGKDKVRIVFSAVNGTGTEFTPPILRAMGYDVIEVAEHAFADETFKNVGNPNPEFDPAWKIPLAYGVQHQADIVIINDPDADRIGLAVNHNGKFVRLNGNETGPLLIEYKLAQLKKQGKMPAHPALYSSFVTSELGDRVAHERYDVNIVKTLIGFKWMGGEIAKEHERNLQFVFAYEEAYGYVLDASTRDKDGIQASVVLAEACWYYKQQGKTLVDQLGQLYNDFGYYKTDQTNLNFKPEEKMTRVAPIMKLFRDGVLDEVAGLKVVKKEDYLGGLYNMPGHDLLKFYLEGKSWFAVRPSGTEPKLKIYYDIVGKNEHDAEEILRNVKAHLLKLMGVEA